MAAAMTLKMRVGQIRGDLERLKDAQLDWSHCVQRDIDQALSNIKVYSTHGHAPFVALASRALSWQFELVAKLSLTLRYFLVRE